MKCSPRPFAAAIAAALFMLSTVAARAETRIALVMAAWEYQGGTLAALPGIDKDVATITKALQSTGFEVMQSLNPTLVQAEDAVEAFGKKLKDGNRNGDAVGVFYFSGHGGEVDGKNYLLPKSARIRSRRDAKNEGLCANTILNRMEESGGRVNLMFLDCCRNDLSKGAGGGLAGMEARGVFIGFATATERESVGAEEGSPYTNVLARYWGTKGLSITDMHTLVTNEVKKVTKELGQEQTPFQYSGLDQLFYVVPPDRPGQDMAQSKQDADYQQLRQNFEKLRKEVLETQRQTAPNSNPPGPAAPQIVQPEPVQPKFIQPPVFRAPAPWLFADSSQRLLTKEELSVLGEAQLWRARNEIYARKGYIFSSERGRNFTQLLGSYYNGVSPDADRIEASFNEYERQNVDNIKAYEARFR